MTDDITKDLVAGMSDSDKLNFLVNHVADLSQQMNVMNQRMTAIEQRLTGVEQQMTAIEQRMTGSETELGGLKELVQARLYDTRPLWEGVIQRLDDQQQQLDELRVEMRTGFARLDNEVRTGLARLDKKLNFVNTDYQRNTLEIRADLDAFSERMAQLEKAA